MIGNSPGDLRLKISLVKAGMPAAYKLRKLCLIFAPIHFLMVCITIWLALVMLESWPLLAVINAVVSFYGVAWFRRTCADLRLSHTTIVRGRRLVAECQELLELVEEEKRA